MIFRVINKHVPPRGSRILPAVVVVAIGILVAAVAMDDPEEPPSPQEQIQALLDTLQDPEVSDVDKQAAQYELGTIYYDLGQLEEAKAVFEDMTETYADLAMEGDDQAFVVDDGVFMAGKISKETGQAVEAEDQLLTLLYAFPASNKYDDAFLVLGQLYEDEGDDSAALEFYEGLVSSFPDSELVVPALKRIGIIYHAQKHFDLSADAYRDIIDREEPVAEDALDAHVALNRVLFDDEVAVCRGVHCCTGIPGGYAIELHADEIRDHYDFVTQSATGEAALEISADYLDFIAFRRHCVHDGAGESGDISIPDIVAAMQAAAPDSPHTRRAELRLARYQFPDAPQDAIETAAGVCAYAESNTRSDLLFEARRTLMDFYGSQGAFEQMHLVIEQCLAGQLSDEQRGIAELQLGFCLFNQHDVDGAYAVFEQIKNDGDLSDDLRASAMYHGADALRVMNQQEQAAQLIDELVAIYPDSSAAVAAQW